MKKLSEDLRDAENEMPRGWALLFGYVTASSSLQPIPSDGCSFYFPTILYPAFFHASTPPPRAVTFQ
jgi:hypothetical protein